MGEEVDGFSNAGSVGCRVYDLVATVMFEGWPDVPPFFAMGIPGRTVDGWFERDQFASRWSERGAIEIKCTKEMGIG